MKQVDWITETLNEAGLFEGKDFKVCKKEDFPLIDEEDMTAADWAIIDTEWEEYCKQQMEEQQYLDSKLTQIIGDSNA